MSCAFLQYSYFVIKFIECVFAVALLFALIV